MTSIRQCQARLQGLSVEEVEMCLEVEAAASVGGSSMKTEAKQCNKDTERTESKTSFSSMFSDRQGAFSAVHLLHLLSLGFHTFIEFSLLNYYCGHENGQVMASSQPFFNLGIEVPEGSVHDFC